LRNCTRLVADLPSLKALYLTAVLASLTTWGLQNFSAIETRAREVFHAYCDWKLPPTQVAVDIQQPQWTVVAVKSKGVLDSFLKGAGVATADTLVSVPKLAVGNDAQVVIHTLKAGPWSCTTAEVSLTVTPATADILVLERAIQGEKNKEATLETAEALANVLLERAAADAQEFADELKTFLDASRRAPAESVKNLLGHKLNQPMVVSFANKEKTPTKSSRGF
jgi:hypothetical protein